MGVPKFYKLFLSVIEGIIVNDVTEPFGLLMDVMGFLHKCTGAVFGYGRTLYNENISPELLAEIKEALKTKTGFERLRLEFLNSIGPALDKIILEKIRPTDILIIGVDGTVGPTAFAKGNQQRIRRFMSGYERNKYDSNLHEGPESKFDTSFLTPGVQFMQDASDAILKWLNSNKSRLPHYTLFSGSDVPGEGEHKIFHMLDKVREYIISNDTTQTTKDKDSTFRAQKFVVYGLDADLGILSMLKDYNIVWVREQFSLDKIDQGVNIDLARNYILNAMRGETEPDNIEKWQKANMIADFTLLSFLIGDDFVPAMMPLTANIKITLDRFMEKYAILNNDKSKFLIDGNGDIVISNLSEIFDMLEEVEKELYNDKAKVDAAERFLALNQGNQEAINKVMELRKINHIAINDLETYTPSPLLQLPYEQFCEYWKTIISIPALISDRIPQSQKISYLMYTDQYTLDNETDAACQDYITGLQWNIKYYLGFQMGNWYYKRAFPPTIKALNLFLKSGKYVPEVVIRKPSDPVITQTQMLVMILNPHFSKNVLMSFFKKESNYVNATINCSFLNTMFPRTISTCYQGKYKSEEHSKIPLLPPIIFEDILKIIPNPKYEHNSKYTEQWILGNQTNDSFSRILKSSIMISRSNEINIIEKVRYKSPLKNEGKLKNSNKGARFSSPAPRRENNSDNNERKESSNHGRNGGFGRGRGGFNQFGRSNNFNQSGRGAGRGNFRRDSTNSTDTLRVGKFRVISKQGDERKNDLL